MNSKLPPKYTILFLPLFVSNTNKGENALYKSAKLYPASMATTDKAYFVSTLPSIVTDMLSFFRMAFSGLESNEIVSGYCNYIQN